VYVEIEKDAVAGILPIHHYRVQYIYLYTGNGTHNPMIAFPAITVYTRIATVLCICVTK